MGEPASKLTERLRAHGRNLPGLRVAADCEEAAAALEQAENALQAISAIGVEIGGEPYDWEQRIYDIAHTALAALAGTAGGEKCEHRDTSFSRTLCACGAMHDYCDDCGRALFCPLDEAGDEP